MTVTRPCDRCGSRRFVILAPSKETRVDMMALGLLDIREVSFDLVCCLGCAILVPYATSDSYQLEHAGEITRL
jgi:hypothetical protein